MKYKLEERDWENNCYVIKCKGNCFALITSRVNLHTKHYLCLSAVVGINVFGPASYVVTYNPWCL